MTADASKDVGKEPFCSIDGSVATMEIKNLKLELTYYPAVSLLDVYLNDSLSQLITNTCTSIFIAASFTVAWNGNNIYIYIYI